MHYSTNTEAYSSSSKDSPSKWNKDGKGYAYKKSSYQYSTSGNNSNSYLNKSPDQNIDQLDALLEDLKNERQVSTRDRDLLPLSSGYRTIERERVDPAGSITKTTRVIKTTTKSGNDHGFDDLQNYSTSDYSTLKSNEVSRLQEAREKSYLTNLSAPENVYESKSKIYESSYSGSELIPSANAPTTRLEKDLQNITLTDDILPVPGTKVTTTVRTYTYEVPAGHAGTLGVNTINRNQKINNSTSYSSLLHDEVNNVSQTYPISRPTVPQTVVYNTESYSTINKNNVVPSQVYEINERRETNTISNNIVPPHHVPAPLPSGGSKTIVYNLNTTENIHSTPRPNYGSSPPHGTHHIPVESGPHQPPRGNLPGQPTTSRYFYKESSNIVNTIHDAPPHLRNEPSIPYSHSTPNKLAPTGYPPRGDGYPPHGHGPPNGSSVTYKYSSTTTNTRHEPEYGAPSPFPVEADDMQMPNGNPPQRVDDLMQSFGNTDAVDRSDIETPHRKREVDTSVASPNQQIIPSVNRAGKEVYYPPGHGMMMTKHEEMSAGSAAGGRWAKGSGMYEYESGSKSKSKTKSGGAMVPVCLPLCCAMPCSIM